MTSIMIRSILFCNQSPKTEQTGFKKHYKPQIWDCWKKSKSYSLQIRETFSDKLERLSFSSVCQLELPYEYMIIPRANSKRYSVLDRLNYYPCRRNNRQHGEIVQDDEDLLVGSFDIPISNPSRANACTWLEDDDIID